MQQRVLSTLLNEMDGVAALEQARLRLQRLLPDAAALAPPAHIAPSRAARQVLLIGATNRPDLLDAALLRPGRFDEQLLVPPPDEKGREQVLAVHTRRMPLADDVQLDHFAARSTGWSGAQLAGLCREAGMEALRADMQAAAVSHDDFERAYARVHSTPAAGELASDLSAQTR